MKGIDKLIIGLLLISLIGSLIVFVLVSFQSKEIYELMLMFIMVLIKILLIIFLKYLIKRGLNE